MDIYNCKVWINLFAVFPLRKREKEEYEGNETKNDENHCQVSATWRTQRK